MPVNHQAELAADMGLSVTEAHRRAQIIDATVDVVAELGYPRASFARIVERAGLSSTRMVSYHFADKNELMTATLTTIIDQHDRFVTEWTTTDEGRAAMVRSYLESEIAFLAAYPRQARALAEIAANARQADGSRMFEMIVRDLTVGRLERQLRQGQHDGTFTDFDVEVAAMTIRHALDGLAQRLGADPDLDLRTYREELVSLFTRALVADT